MADPTFPATDGVVYALAIRGDTLYLGGSFHAAGGVMTGGFAALDAQSGAPRRVWPRVAGRVYATASDGKGGWYFGGFFTSIAGVGRNGLAHIRADGSLDAWNPSVHGQVYALAIACSTVYVGGSFDSIGGQPRACFGAVDAASGAVLPIN
ncbi:MAG TPA: delta-60 repeat domain-containing protein, partial [Terriglobales bacterium]|nr:delta-60 repeat domain-containing protein [Terriglobales bacterium]